MSIALGPIFDKANRDFGASGGSRFQDAFLAAVNSVVADLHAQMGGELFDWMTASDYNETLALDAHFTPVIQAGVTKYLHDSGEWQKKPDPVVDGRYQRALEQAIILALKDDDFEVGFEEDEDDE